MADHINDGGPATRPILFQGEMVRAILSGVKTQTRRVVKRQPDCESDGILADYAIDASGKRAGFALWYLNANERAGCDWYLHSDPQLCPYGMSGDRLWVRESWSTHACFDAVKPSDLTTRSFHYAADGACVTGKGRPSIHMPRFASRILLEVAEVRVERLRSISSADCWAEGIPSSPDVDPVHEYCDLWESINGAGSWAANPLVWAVSFRNISQQKEPTK